jgi:hypothetical protein
MFFWLSFVLSTFFIVTAFAKNNVPAEQTDQSITVVSPDSVVQNRTISAEQLKSKVEYMLTKVLGFGLLPHIAVTDRLPEHITVIEGPFYEPVTNILFLPLNSIHNLSDQATIQRKYPQIISSEGMSDEMLLAILAHQMGRFKHREKILKLINGLNHINSTLDNPMTAAMLGRQAFLESIKIVREIINTGDVQFDSLILLGKGVAIAIVVFVGFRALAYYRASDYKNYSFRYPAEYAIQLLKERLSPEQAARCLEVIALYHQNQVDTEKLLKQSNFI